MLHSIRWRLVASYVLLTLLTAVAISVLAMSLIRRYVDRQEQAYLRANAEAIARQAASFLQPAALYPALDQLVQMAAFLGNVQVRILDDRQQVMAQSDARPANGLAWVVRAEETETRFMAPPVVVFGMAPLQAARLPQTALPLQEIGASAAYYPHACAGPKPGPAADTNVIFVQKAAGVWGDRLTFVPGLPTSPGLMHSGAVAAGDGMVARTQVVQAAAGMPRMEAAPLAADEPADAPDEPVQVVTVPIQAGPAVLGYVELSRPSAFGAEPLAAIRQALWVAAVAASLLAIGLGLAVSRGLTAPVQSLAAAAAGMSRGDLAVRAPVRGHDELGRLAQQFNAMAARLQTAFAELAAERDALRRFIADASHELRTPITALRTFIELLQEGAVQDPTAQREFLHESQAQIERLAWITRNLLDLSRLDAGLAALDQAEHSPADLLAAAVAPFRALAGERGVTLTLDLRDAPAAVVCDGARVERALCNLLDNALKYTPAGGCVHAGVERAPGHVCFWVHDTGAGIDPAELPHIFERFHRGAAAQQPGSGLGLAIVQSVVQAHGGRVEVASRVGQGSRFTLWLPASLL